MKQYEKIATACGVDELVVNAEGAHFVPDMLEALNQTLETNAKEKADAQTLIQSLKTQVGQAETTKNDAVSAREKELNDAHEQAINTLKEEHTTALNAEIAAREKAEKELKEVKDQLATANQTITDQKGQIEQLTTAAAAVTTTTTTVTTAENYSIPDTVENNAKGAAFFDEKGQQIYPLADKKETAK